MVGFYGGDPIDSTAEEAAGTSLTPAGTGQGIGAAFMQGVAQTPTARIYNDMAGNDAQPVSGETARQSPMMQPDEANQQFGIPGALSFSSPVTQDVAQGMYDAKHADAVRQDVINRTAGPAAGIGEFLARTVPQFMDPVNLATAFVPGLGEARTAAVLGDAARPFLTRAVEGATQGAIGQAALEPINYALSQDEHNDWTMGSALSDIAFGGILGGGLHTVLGALHGSDPEAIAASLDKAPAGDPAAALDVTPTPEQMANPITARMEAAGPEARDGALRNAIAGLVDDRPNTVSAGLDIMDAQRGGDATAPLTMPGSADAELPQEGGAAAMSQPSMNGGQAPPSLLTFLTQRGGVRDPGGDLDAMDAGLQRVGLLRRNGGQTLDYAREAAEEAGYLPPGSDTNALLEAIRTELSGQKVFPPEYQAGLDADRMAARDSDQYASAMSGAREEVMMQAEDQGIDLAPDEIDHAAHLTIGGLHPEDAIRSAVQATEDTALRVTDAKATLAREAQRPDPPDIVQAKQQAEVVQKRAPNIAGVDLKSDLGAATSALRTVDEQLQGARGLRDPDAPREPVETEPAKPFGQEQKPGQEPKPKEIAPEESALSPEDEAELQSIQEEALKAEGDAKMYEAAGQCLAMRGL